MAYLTFGHVGNYATKACGQLSKDGIEVAHYDMRFAKPLDEKLLHSIFKKYKYIITVEDGCLQGGFGSAVLEFMADHGYTSKIVRLGIPDRVVEHGTQLELHRECGFDPDGLIANSQKDVGHHTSLIIEYSNFRKGQIHCFVTWLLRVHEYLERF